jgi:MFS transporter, FHS family, L-fucose permease
MQAVDTTAPAPRPAVGATGLYTLALIISLFFLWGVANNLNDILIKQFKKAFELSDLQAGLVQSAFYAGYFLLAIPASLCTRRFGYKAALVTGLGLYALGAFCFLPAAQLQAYGMFLAALFIIACGLAFLETAANPLVTVLGPAEGAARRLNFAQSFNPLGSITGVLVGKYFIFSGTELSGGELAALGGNQRAAYHAAEASAVLGPYVIIGVIALLWAVLIATTRLPAAAGARATDGGGAKLLRLVLEPNFALAVVAQFFYVGAQVGVWSYLIRYAQMSVPSMTEQHAADFLTGALVLFMVGRFAGTACMRVVAPSSLLAGFALVAAVLTGVAWILPGTVGLYGLVATGFFMSIMFPTIFALGLRGLDDEGRKVGSSVLVMAIIGGAVLTAVMGGVSDRAGIHNAMIVPVVCFLVVLGFAVFSGRMRSAV